MTVSVTEVCPDCGTSLPPDVGLGGLCPRCLLGLGLTVSSVSSGPETDSNIPTLSSPVRAFSDSPTALYPETLSADGPTFTPGQLLGDRYRIEAPLGRGGMGEVWRAYDLKLRLEVALKSLHPGLFETEDAMELLRDEVRAAREVTSPNVCRLYDLVEVGDQELVSMEYVDGVTLLQHLKQDGPLELKEANEIGSQLLAGLEAVHDAGLVHRDIKPENVMLTRTGRVVVTDFGLTSPSGSGSIGGTPAYMPPEQARGEVTDARADVFSAGMVLAEMLLAERGPDESSRQTFWEEIRQQPPVLPESPWKPILSQALSPDADARYATAADLARALEEVSFRVEGVEHEHPYPGLASFQEDDAEFFFGREAEVEAVWKRLQQVHLLGLIGPSGSGKSSFVNAGLLPAAPEGWKCVVMAPSTDPFAALGRALLPELETDREAMSFLARLEGPEPALDVLREQRAKHGELLLIVDQFEELFTQSSAEVQERFVELLGQAALEADVHVLLSMRDDYLFQCQSFEVLRPLFSELTPLGPPTGSSLRRAIVQPALRCGYRFENEAVVEEMLQEVTKERAALPLIAFTAAQVWEHRDEENGYLTAAAYDEVGGVSGALAQHAEATLEQIGSDHIPIVRELFRNLVTAQGTRASRDREELLSVFDGPDGGVGNVGEGLAPSRVRELNKASFGRTPEPLRPYPSTPSGSRRAAAEILDTLIDSRLLTSYEIPEREGRAGHHRIEIIHESLLTAWPRLVRWQMQDAEGAKVRDELRHQAQLWIERDRPDDLLWTGTSFKEVQLWRERYPGGLSADEEAFVRAMTSKAERRRRNARIVIASGTLVLLAVIGVVTALWRQSVVAKHRAVEEMQRAEAASLFALAQPRLEDHPTAALAYATTSLELADNPEVRRFALEALWRGPTELRVPGSGYLSLDFSPDGRWLATSGCEIWPSNGDPPKILEGCERGVEGFFNPAGDKIAYALGGLMRSEIGVWAFPEGRFLRTLPVGQNSTLFRFSPDGERIVTRTDFLDGDRYEVDVRSWPLAGGEPDRLARLEIPQESVGAYVGVDPTASRVAWTAGTRFSLAELKGTQVDMATAVSLAQDSLIDAVTFDAEVRNLATWDETRAPRIWSLESASPRLTRTLAAVNAPMFTVTPWSLRFDSTGSMLGQAFGILWYLDAPPDADPQRLRRAAGAIQEEKDEQGFGLAFHPNGLWVATGHPGSTSLWPLARSYPHVLRGHEEAIVPLQFSPDGRWLVSGSADGSVRLWPLAGRSSGLTRILHRTEGQWGFPRCLAVAPDGSFVVVGTWDGKVVVLPLDGGRSRTLVGLPESIVTVTVGPESRQVAAGTTAMTEDAFVRVWDLATGEMRLLGEGERRGTQRLEFEDQGRLVAASFGRLQRWDLDGEEPRLLEEAELVGPDSEDRAVSIRPDVRRALYVDPEQRLWVKDLETQTTRELSSHGTSVATAILGSSGEVVVSVDHLGIVRAGPATGEKPHLLLGHKGEVNSVAVSPDGRWIATGADDKLIYLWPMPDTNEKPLHTWPREALLAKLRSLTNLRAVEDPDSPTGWKLEIGPFPGWEEVPTW